MVVTIGMRWRGLPSSSFQAVHAHAYNSRRFAPYASAESDGSTANAPSAGNPPLGFLTSTAHAWFTGDHRTCPLRFGQAPVSWNAPPVSTASLVVDSLGGLGPTWLRAIVIASGNTHSSKRLQVLTPTSSTSVRVEFKTIMS